MIGRRGERGSGISVLAARHDDDDDHFKHVRVSSDSMLANVFDCHIGVSEFELQSR